MTVILETHLHYGDHIKLESGEKLCYLSSG